jgi:hypothetical protein
MQLTKGSTVFLSTTCKITPRFLEGNLGLFGLLPSFVFLTVAKFFTAIISIRKRLPKEIFTTIAWQMKIAACQHGKCVLRFATIRGKIPTLRGK